MDLSRIERFSKTLGAPCLLERPEDLFYLTGMHVSKGRFFISKKRAILFVDGRYIEKAKKQVFCEVLPYETFQKIDEEQIQFDSSYMSYQSFLNLKDEMSKVYWQPVANPLQKMRCCKDFAEIEKLRKAAQLTKKGIDWVVSHLKEGISEDELALEFELFVRKHGAQRLSFDPIIAFGENSAYPHYRPRKDVKLQKNQVVLIDVGAVVENYCGDLTRITYFNTPDPEVKQLEKIVKRAQFEAISAIKPKIECARLDEIVREIFLEEGVLKYYLHSLGHGVGLEVHEPPTLSSLKKGSKELLEKGMVITIEPGLYRAEIGGVRLEEMVVVNEDGAEIL